MAKHDVIIVGTGQAGPSLAGPLAAAGMNVAIIERNLFGGTCVNTGCMPTKALMASAYAAHLARRAAEYGVTIDGTLGVDMKAVKSRNDAISGVSSGALSGGNRFSRGALYLMLQNRLYRAEVAHKGQIYPGLHEAIIAPELWQSVQDRLAANRHERSLSVGAEAPSLLAGLIVDADGNRMTPAHATKRGRAIPLLRLGIAADERSSASPPRIACPGGRYRGSPARPAESVFLVTGRCRRRARIASS
jgi:2-polyprenyl-6-methoxyphenol hydroxylase-like FAD-dependent oxidoreductase